MDIEYKVYIINKAKIVLGEIRHLAKNLRIKKSLNLGDTIEFTMDLHQFQGHIGENASPRSWLVRGATDIVVFRKPSRYMDAKVHAKCYHSRHSWRASD